MGRGRREKELKAIRSFLNMVIGLCGFKCSGKSEVAKYISEVYGFKRLNFKDALVEEIKSGFPDLLDGIISVMDKTEYDGVNQWTIDRLFKDKPLLMRALMQNYGTEVRRKDDINYWTSKWDEAITYSSETNFIADDVRFQNELDAIKKHNGILIRVMRSDILSGGGHSSEKEQAIFDADFNVLAARGNLESLYHQVDGIMAHISAD